MKAALVILAFRMQPLHMLELSFPATPLFVKLNTIF